MKHVTTVKQSKLLTEILPKESADMCYRIVAYNPNDTHVYQPYCFLGTLESDIPAWSLAALLDVINQVKEINHQRVTILVGRFAGGHWYVELLRVQDERAVVLEHSKELVDACVEIIISLYEQKLL